jgi:hypothetical protein
MFSLPFLLSSNLLEVLCPLKSIHVIKFSITKTHSQNLIFLLVLWTYWCLPSSWSPRNFYTLSLTPFLPSRHKLFFSQILYINSRIRLWRSSGPPQTDDRARPGKNGKEGNSPTRENALGAVPTNASFFNTSTNFSGVKMWGPGSAHYFIAPLLPVTRVYRYHQQCPGQIWFLQNNCLVFFNTSDPENHRFCVYQHIKRTARFQRRTGGYLTNSNCFCGPWVIQ